MLLFRSEEHLDRWLSAGNRPRGETMTVAQQWALAVAWFEGRDEPGWRKRTTSKAEALFRDAGLTDNFWSLS